MNGCSQANGGAGGIRPLEVLYGGAPLLGVNGVCIIGHGSSNAKAVSAALAVASQAVRGGLTASIGGRVGTERSGDATSGGVAGHDVDGSA